MNIEFNFLKSVAHTAHKRGELLKFSSPVIQALNDRNTRLDRRWIQLREVKGNRPAETPSPSGAPLA